jgi:hypothetical protein
MRRIGLSFAALLILLAPPAAAEDAAGCGNFAWPMARERAWFAAADKPTVAAGDRLGAAPQGAFVLRLRPGAQASFAAPPERKPKSADLFGGAVWLPAVERPGIYQVTLSDEAWVDLVQEGRYARAVANSMQHDCPGLRKSVRFELGPGPFVLQLSGAAADTIVVAIAPGQ